jgi:mono/diheme cytochrome c family protein
MHRVLCIASALAFLLLPVNAVRADEKSSSVERGKQIYNQCAGCHDANGTERRRGSGLKGLFSKERMRNGNKPTDNTVLEQINEGSRRMRGFRDVLSDQEKKDLLAYLKTL